MKVVFFGGRPLGALCLEELVKGKINIPLVVPNYDEFESNLWYHSTVEIATASGLHVYKTKNICNDEGIKLIRDINPDVIFSIFFLQILKNPILDIPKLGCINIHFAPLPKYRGFYPQMHAIINGEKTHGVTMHFMDEDIDSGDVIIQKSVPISGTDTGKDLYFRCVDVGLEIFKEGLYYLLMGKRLPRHPQDNSQATYYKKEIPNNREIDWSCDAERIYNFIRALTFEPFEPPFFYIGTKRMVVIEEERLPKSDWKGLV